MNERITENIVRKYFRNNDNAIFEEQSSKNNKIDKLLKNASKGGNNKGFPDFIIQFKNNSNFIIVIECKADIKYHKSKFLDNYKDYAVDGVLLYSSFLSKEYDVLSIAVSGDTEDNLKISHFLQLKDTKEYYSVFNDDKFLTLDNYLEGYKKDERKFNQDFCEILKYSKNLNDRLHSLKIQESNRSLLISGILIALQDKAFYNAYKWQKPNALAQNLINTIEHKLTETQNEYIKDIITNYKFIETHTILSKEENKLRDIIEEVDGKINNFIKTYKYFDTIGQFYIEFLRYANNDKGLGIVLTPPHITELFTEIANIDKDSIVLDTCTGTGGFLISAMKKMINDANNDRQKEIEIQEKQIIGIELQHNIFALTCSNMHIHGDGKSNLIKGSCFDKNIINYVKKFKPNVGFLNPPYKSNKDDIEELDFVLNNLSMIEKGSYCVAIVPMSCALAQSGKKLILKEKLLQNHTLDAVFSMPNELFFNSKIGVVTCIMVFKAKEKHLHNYKTYFGYWKDDGFTKKKTNGRADYDNKWDNIKKEWLSNYKNKEEITGHSIKKIVSEKDEWCAEAYMETDYSILNKQDFEQEIKKYLSYLFLYSKKEFEIRKNSNISSDLLLDINNWKWFQYSDIFIIERGKSNPEDDAEQETLLVGASQNLNGTNGETIKANPYYEGNFITVGNGGNTGCGQTFYQMYPFNAKSTVNILTLKNYNLNPLIAMFLITIIKMEKFRFDFGRGWSIDRMKIHKIKLPADNQGNPDWHFMENYIKTLPYSINL